MTEERVTSPNVIKLLRRAQDTQIFLRLAAIQLRRIAERVPDIISQELKPVAQQLEAEAADLACRDIEWTEGEGQCFTSSK
jgi:hypothetical protein